MQHAKHSDVDDPWKGRTLTVYVCPKPRKAASGVGGPHIGPPYVWPMALIVQALTSDDDQEIEGLLKVRWGCMQHAFSAIGMFVWPFPVS